MHPTEVDSYDFAHLEQPGIWNSMAAAEVLERAYAYLSFRGHVGDGRSSRSRFEGGGVGRADSIPDLGQREALSLMRDRIAPDDDLARFVRAHITDSALRDARVAELERFALPVAHAAHEVVEM